MTVIKIVRSIFDLAREQNIEPRNVKITVQFETANDYSKAHYAYLLESQNNVAIKGLDPFNGGEFTVMGIRFQIADVPKCPTCHRIK